MLSRVGWPGRRILDLDIEELFPQREPEQPAQELGRKGGLVPSIVVNNMVGDVIAFFRCSTLDPIDHHPWSREPVIGADKQCDWHALQVRTAGVT